METYYTRHSLARLPCEPSRYVRVAQLASQRERLCLVRRRPKSHFASS